MAKLLTSTLAAPCAFPSPPFPTFSTPSAHPNLPYYSYPERIVDIAQRYGIDAKMTLDNILVARAYSHEQQNSLLTAVAAMMVKDQFSLLIVDSFTSLFRVEFVGREELAPRQQAIASMMNKLSKIASEFNICVVITKYVLHHMPPNRER